MRWTFKPNPETKTIGTIETSEIIENTIYTANFFPEHSYVLRIRGKGFKRHQIRLMMGILFDLGEGKVGLDFIKETLEPEKSFKLENREPPFNDPFALFAAVINKEITLKPFSLSSLENNMIVTEILEAARKGAKTNRTIKIK